LIYESIRPSGHFNRSCNHSV